VRGRGRSRAFSWRMKIPDACRPEGDSICGPGFVLSFCWFRLRQSQRTRPLIGHFFRRHGGFGHHLRITVSRNMFRGVRPGFGCGLPALEAVIACKRDVLELLISCYAQGAGLQALQYNVVKLGTNQPTVSFLLYEDFDAEPFPALLSSRTLRLSDGRWTTTDFRLQVNPPILHRKETLLPPAEAAFD
jgi:hypothetical protein